MLHGVHTNTERTNKLNLEDAQTNIIAALVTVPTFLLSADNKTLNTPVPIRNYQDIADYAGVNLPDYTGYDTLDTIMTESEGATVYMINVFDEATHKTAVAEADMTVTNKKVVIDKYVKSLTSVKNGSTPIAESAYTVAYDDSGNTVITFTDNLSTVKIAYEYYDVTQVGSSDFVGAVDSDGIKSGSKAISDILALYGDDVNIIIAPVYSAIPAVRTALDNVAADLKARVYADAPLATRVNTAIQGRTSDNPTVDLRCVSPNVTICLPWVKRYNQHTDTVETKAPSAVAAGLRVYLNKTENVAKSLDNTVCKTVLGLEYPVEFILNKENTESNALNGAGITTFINYKGGYRIYGARNCAYPSESGIETFDSVIDTRNFIEKTIENSSFECVGSRLTKGFIDNVLDVINAKFNEWKNAENQIILGGNAWFDESRNPAQQLANGKVRISYKFCPPPVVEELEYSSYIDINIITQALTNAD
ncbi:MAG: phage tail sheath subtilisin-like domain-containing protein [Candidatus Gastranaerophilales bacterium]|nr:phage tail sheath subtilisin-like domain-containing protein [Candidatus Gastranaerophilales bacterium]